MSLSPKAPFPDRDVFYVADPLSSIETRLLPIDLTNM
jgi:hypothetical protein